MRYRFDEETIKRLLRIAWWDWPEETVRESIEWFYRPIAEFLENFESETPQAPVEAVAGVIDLTDEGSDEREDGITPQQRFLATMRYQPVDRAPYGGAGLWPGDWPETLDRWKREGHAPSIRAPVLSRITQMIVSRYPPRRGNCKRAELAELTLGLACTTCHWRVVPRPGGSTATPSGSQ